MRERVGRLDVVKCHLDVLDRARRLAAARAQLALVLVQERDRVDQGEILLVIAPQCEFRSSEEGQRIGVWISAPR